MKKTFLFLLLLSLGLINPVLGEEARKSSNKTAPAPLQRILDKKCGYSLHYPWGSQVLRPGKCLLKIILPSVKGQEWIQEASLTLEVTGAANGEATTNPVDGDEPISFLNAGGLKFEKTIDEDSGAGHVHVMVSYTAVGKKHQYHFLGILSAGNPEADGKPVKNWNAKRSAEKLFDGLVLGFRPLE